MRRALYALILLWLSLTAARADERIADFVSDVTIETDGALTVQETIAWTFKDIGQKRGLLRDFPTQYADRNGLRFNVGFEVQSVKRNGQDENYAVETIPHGKRVRIGSAGVFLPEGRHVYEIVYRTTRQLGFFDNFDELYWNATGNAWSMPIEHAEAMVRLPHGANLIQHDAYTGRQGESGKDFQVTSVDAGTYRAETLRPLDPGEGFTVAVGFTKGIVAPPGETTKALWFIEDNASIAVIAASLLAVFGYFIWAWLRVGRDPPRGTIIPLFSPPADMGPAGVRYVWKQAFDDKTFAASLVGLAVKGRVKIIDNDGSYVAQKLSGSETELVGSEKALYDAMLQGTTAFKTGNHKAVGAMRSALDKSLRRRFDDVAFFRNLGWSFAGLGLSLVGLLLAALLLPGEQSGMGLFTIVWSGIWWTAVLAFLVAAIRGFMRPGLVNKIRSVSTILLLSLFMLVGTGVLVFLVATSGSLALYALTAAAVILAALNFLFFRLMRAPTIDGRKLLDQIEGFRMYMMTAEEDRLNALHPPEKTPELFEKYLPYALALDCENRWAEKFAGVLAAAGVVAPAWYAGTHWNTGDMSGFTDSIGSSLASSTAAAASPPGSSSGSGGGGSSGGGSGGGGGSSW